MTKLTTKKTLIVASIVLIAGILTSQAFGHMGGGFNMGNGYHRGGGYSMMNSNHMGNGYHRGGGYGMMNGNHRGMGGGYNNRF